MGERFFDALLADTLSERYRPCKESGNMLDTCEAVEEAMAAWQKIFKEIDNSTLHTTPEEYGETLRVMSGCLDDHDCLRSPLSRLGDWFAGLFAIDPTITID